LTKESKIRQQMEKFIPVWFFNDSIQFKSRSEAFGHAGETAVSTELKQLHSQRVFESKHYHELSFKKQVHALKYRMFLMLASPLPYKSLKA